MLKLAKFVIVCFVLGTGALLAACYLNPGFAGRQMGAHGADDIAGSAGLQIEVMAHDIAREAPARLHSLTASAGPFVRANIVTGRLQLDGMRNSIASALPDLSWLSSSSSGSDSGHKH